MNLNASTGALRFYFLSYLEVGIFVLELHFDT